MANELDAQETKVFFHCEVYIAKVTVLYINIFQGILKAINLRQFWFFSLANEELVIFMYFMQYSFAELVNSSGWCLYFVIKTYFVAWHDTCEGCDILVNQLIKFM